VIQFTKSSIILLEPAMGNIQGGQKVSHYQKSSLSRIKNRQGGYISHQF